MDFLKVLCILFSRLHNEKTPSAAFHLLRGKRSGQMMQDVAYYEVHSFFGILPKLPKEVFDDGVHELLEKKYITIDEQSILQVTPKGEEFVRSARTLYFNGWNYRGREEVFFARLSLIVQTLSHFKEGVKNFMPVQRDPDIQQFVKSFLRHHPIQAQAFSLQLKDELQLALNECQMDKVQKMILTHRLIGFQTTGWTWNQLSEQLAMPSINVKLYYIESLHMLLETILAHQNYPLLKKIAHQIKIEDHLNYSTQRTKVLFDQGCTLEEISAIRQLKLSTIEDHIVEIALDNEHFPFEKFVSKEESIHVQKKATELETKRLRRLKEFFPQLSYFQLRLILSVPMKGVEVK